MGASSRRKGADYEREVAKVIREELGVEARRGYQRGTGDEEPDVVGLGGEWAPECKYGLAIKLSAPLEDGWAQALAAASKRSAKPVLIFRRQGGKSRVALALGDFLGLLRELEALREQVRCG